jgi:hypothetical protein
MHKPAPAAGSSDAQKLLPNNPLGVRVTPHKITINSLTMAAVPMPSPPLP